MSPRVPSDATRARIEDEAIGKADEASYLIVQIRGSEEDRAAYVRYARGQLIATDHLFPKVGVGHIPVHPRTDRAGLRLPALAHQAVASIYARLMRVMLDQTPIHLTVVPDPKDNR